MAAKKISIARIFLLCIFIFFPLREALALRTGETSYFRLGELLFAASPLFYLLVRKRHHNKYKISLFLLCFAAYSILFGLVLGNNVNSSYAIKFLMRCSLIYIFLLVCETGRIRISGKFLELLFKYIVIIESVFCAIEFLGIQILGFEAQPYDSTLWGLPRLTGTATESGFLIPILAPCYYYFLCTIKANKYWFTATFLMLLLSTSSFGYAVLIFVPFYRAILTKKKSGMLKFVMYAAIALAGIFIIALYIPQLNEVLGNALAKIIAFGSSNEGDMDWSAAERLENRLAGIRGFLEFPWFQRLFGGGLGVAQAISEKYVVIHFTSEECGIAYLGLLLNLGIAGLGLMFAVIYKCIRLRINNVYSNAIFIGFLVQALQFFIITNIWLYFFWFEVGLLILIKRNRFHLVPKRKRAKAEKCEVKQKS